MTTNKVPNRLIHEKSPYLLQHAYNPVDWYPWGEEAFKKAKEENMPLFVSIGYSTCHWCHVMEKESFEDEGVARLLNERFVSIKIDREERPDLDSIYMSVCQAMTGQGGWPLNVFLTPEQVPFYAGTYFPKHSRYGHPGMVDVITQLYDTYIHEPQKIKVTGEKILEVIQPSERNKHEAAITEQTVKTAYNQLTRTFDERYGGFGSAPKFPTAHHLMFLLRYYDKTGEEQALQMVLKTLDGLSRGGIYDHIGYGFSRYSTDDLFLVPHFEKMLYDNAMLLMAFTEAFQVTGKQELRKTAQEIITYVLRDMQHSKGGFYSAEDADSEGVEGKFYIWDYYEIMDHLGDELGELFCAIYDITPDGNFEGENIPNLIREPIDSFAKNNDLEPEGVREQLESARKLLFGIREKRIHPHKDDKILTSWNGLMIASLAKAGRVFDDHSALEAAKKAVQFMEENLFIDGRLMVRYREGEVKEKGFIDDYAYLLWGYIEMYEATVNLSYLKKAKQLANDMISLFWDQSEGGFFFYGSDQEQLLIRPKELYDGALPSGNSVAALQLLRLARLTGDFTLEEIVQNLFDSCADELNHYPMGHTYMLMAYLTTQLKMKEVIVLTPRIQVDSLLGYMQKKFLPGVTYLAAEQADSFRETSPFAADYQPLNNQSTYYICDNFVCHQPVTTMKEAIKLMQK